MEFCTNHVGEGSASDAWVRKNDLARADLLELSLNLYWSQVDFVAPAVRFDIYAYALGFLAGIAHAFEFLTEKTSVELVMDDSGEELNLYRRGLMIIVDHERGSVEAPFSEVSRTFRQCSLEALGQIYSHYPGLQENPEVKQLGRRLARLPAVVRT